MNDYGVFSYKMNVDLRMCSIFSTFQHVQCFPGGVCEIF